LKIPKEETVMAKVWILKLLLPGGYSILVQILFFLKKEKFKRTVDFPSTFE